MTLPVVPRPRAEQDVDEFFFYLGLERQRPSTAAKFLDALEQAYQRLSEHPEIGAPQSMANERLRGLRMWPVPRFEDRLIYYIAYPDRIDVIRILGAPQDRETLLGEE